MEVEIITKRTIELSEREISGIYTLFEEVFKKKRTNKAFHEQFENTVNGYSYHALAKIDDKVVGHNVYLPFYYLHNRDKFMVCLSVDAMIHPEYRGHGLYRRLLLACEEMAKSEGCALRIGFPNDNSYPLQVRAFKYNDVGLMDTYILPINVGNIKRVLYPFNFLSRAFAKFMTSLGRLSKSTAIYEGMYRKDRVSFDKYRYKWFGGGYNFRNIDGIEYVFKDSDFKGKKATFLMDVYPLSPKNFDKAVWNLYKERNKDIPMLIYVGNLPFRPKSMIKIPHFVEPKHFHFVTKILDSENVNIGTDSLNIKNWELNLSNYDLL